MKGTKFEIWAVQVVQQCSDEKRMLNIGLSLLFCLRTIIIESKKVSQSLFVHEFQYCSQHKCTSSSQQSKNDSRYYKQCKLKKGYIPKFTGLPKINTKVLKQSRELKTSDRGLRETEEERTAMIKAEINQSLQEKMVCKRKSNLFKRNKSKHQMELPKLKFTQNTCTLFIQHWLEYSSPFPLTLHFKLSLMVQFGPTPESCSVGPAEIGQVKEKKTLA